MISHLFFDLDGTLTDPRDGIIRCIAHALTAMKATIPADDVLETFIGPPLALTFETLLGSRDEALLKRAINAYRERFTSVGIFENRVYPDISSALAALTKDFSMSLVTSKPGVFARRILDHFGLSRYFEAVYGPDLSEVRYTKASLIERALMRGPIAPATAFMIGDRKEDIEAAKANGVGSIGVTWGYGSRAELEGAGADHIVCSVAEMLSLLRMA